jgi:hypothetical protein
MQPHEGEVLIDFVGWSDGNMTAPNTFFASSPPLSSVEPMARGMEAAQYADKSRRVRALFMVFSGCSQVILRIILK